MSKITRKLNTKISNLRRALDRLKECKIALVKNNRTQFIKHFMKEHDRLKQKIEAKIEYYKQCVDDADE